MEQKILKIIEKVKNLLKYDREVNWIFKFEPDINLKAKGDKVEIKSITFANYDKLIIYPTKVVYEPEMQTSKVILTYSSFEELLRM